MKSHAFQLRFMAWLTGPIFLVVIFHCSKAEKANAFRKNSLLFFTYS